MITPPDYCEQGCTVRLIAEVFLYLGFIDLAHIAKFGRRLVLSVVSSWLGNAWSRPKVALRPHLIAVGDVFIASHEGMAVRFDENHVRPTLIPFTRNPLKRPPCVVRITLIPKPGESPVAAADSVAPEAVSISSDLRGNSIILQFRFAA